MPETERWEGAGLSRRTVAVLVAAALLGSLLWYADARVRHHETAALTRCSVSVHHVGRLYDVRMATMAAYVRPSDGPSGSRRVVALMRRTARRMLPRAVAADRRCRAVGVLPWHVTGAARRRLLLAESMALLGRVRAGVLLR